MRTTRSPFVLFSLIVSTLMSSLLLSLMAGSAAAQSAESEDAGLPTATVARFDEAPTIDGEMSSGEWDDALLTQPFMGWQRLRAEPRMARAYMGFTDERLYMAVVSGVPPHGPKADKKFRDGRMIFNSGVEVWIDPNRDNRDAGSGAMDYYKFMGNPIGTIKDIRFDPQGAPDVGWNADWQFKNSVDVEAQRWVAEISIPWTEFGWPEDRKPAGRSIGLLIARNFKAGWNQVTWLPLGASFVNKAVYPRIRLTEDAPTVRVETLGEKFYSGQVNMRLRVHNPGAARQAKVNVKVTSSNMPQILGEETLELPANGSSTYQFETPKGRLHAHGRHTLNLNVTNPDTGEIYYRSEGLNWTEPEDEIWRSRDKDDPAKAVQIAYYPSYQFVRLHLEPSYLGKEASDIKSANVTITGPNGDEVFAKELAWEKNPHKQRLEVGELVGGDYTLSVKLEGRDEPFTRQFTRKHFPWEGNGLGITDKVYPPFEPVRVEGETVSVVQRAYDKTGLGLWGSVRALDRELLAAPMQLRVNGETALEGTGRFTEKADHQAVYQGKAEHDAVKVQTRTITEYDGCMRVEMQLAPGAEQQQLENLTLDIPIKDSEVPLWHVSTTGSRLNPVGEPPEGTGHIWDTRDFPDGEWYGGFRPYIWLGGERRGLSWFADNDKGWVLDVDPEEGTYDPAFSLHRKDGVLTLRVHFVQKPITLKEKRQITFGLMASPAKPMPDGWRGIGRPDTQNFRFSMGAKYGLAASFPAKYPVNGDFSIFDASQAARLGAPVDRRHTVQAWVDANTQNMEPELRQRFENMLPGGIGRARSVGTDYYSVYFEEFHSTSTFHDEVPTFFSEWTGNTLRQDLPRQPKSMDDWGHSIGTKNLAPSYRDFGVWYGAKWLRRGFGLYFDNAFPKRTYDTVTTNAYRLPSGRIQPSANMWAHRKYLKRLWVLHQQLYNPRTPQMMMIHMTNTHILPYMVWNQANLDLEWLMTAEPAQAKYAPDLLRAESIGLQSGNVPLAIAGTMRGKATEKERKHAERTRWAAMLVHEIKLGISAEPFPEPLVEFGYGLDDTTVFNYWDENPPVSISDNQCKWLLLKRDGKLMALLTTWNAQPNEVTVTLDTQQLGLTPSKATNAESGETVPFQNGKFTFQMNGYGVRIFRIE